MTDYTVGDTLHIAFSTRAFATGIPTVLAGTPVVSAYEDAGATAITAGITISVDHGSPSVVGLNMLTIVATGGNGFESGKDYNLVVTTGTVGGVSVVGEVVGRFTIGRSAAAVDLANGTDGLGAIKADTAASLLDTNELQGDWVDGGRLDLLLDAIPTTAMRGTDSAALASVCTEARLAELDAANLPADIDAVLLDTDELQTDWANGGRLDLLLDAVSLEATVAALNDLSAANVNAEVVDVLKTDVITLPGQEAPPLTPTFEQAVAWLYKVFRNRKAQTATQWSLFADDEITVDSKAPISDDGTTAIKQEIVTGP